MGFLSSVLLCLACLATEDVELKPVAALSFNCNRLNGDQNRCQQSSFCSWQNPNCIDDPCLANGVLANTDDTCSSSNSAVTCGPKDLHTTLLGHDCVTTTPDTGILCTTTEAPSAKRFDYCSYAYIRDQKCPDSICTTTSTTDAGCVKFGGFDCQLLASEVDCGLVPKCWYNSSANQCQKDPCFVGSADVNCANHVPAGSGLSPNDCVDFKPLKSGTTNIQNYCLYKENKNPNICYFAGKNVSESNANYLTDYTQTYPTYNFGSQNPTCAGTLTGCEGTGECYTTANKQGALAGLYCTDGTHGNAASVLRVPTLLVFLVVSVLSVLVL